MIQLAKAAYGEAYNYYLRHSAFFPLIGAVLLNTQDGVVYSDRQQAPRRFYVEHKFGFAQAFGEPNPVFDAVLHCYLLKDRAFHTAKVRLYTPEEPFFLFHSELDAQRSQRQRFELDITSPGFILSRQALKNKHREIRLLDYTELSIVKARFELMDRFWSGEEDFLMNAHAIVSWQGKEPTAICYAAAVAKKQAEIDVLTAPEYRQNGLGTLVVQAFNEHCLAQSLHPVWDCFTNNAGSMALCNRTGFVPSRPPYSFYTLNKF